MKFTEVTDITDFLSSVGSWSRCTYPSIHFFVSRSRSVVDCARVQAFTFLLTKTLSRSRLVLWCVVWCGGVLWWCVCCCVVVVRVLLCCGEAWHTLSLLLSLLPLLFPFLFLSSFSFSFFSCSSSYSCSCSFSFSSFFCLPFYSLFSSLPFTPTNTVQSTDQQTTLRRVNVMWRRVRSQQLPTNCTECSHLSSSLPPSLPHREKREDFLLQEYFRRGNYFVLQSY